MTVTLPGVGDQLADLPLRGADGTPVGLRSIIDRPTIVPIVRYYGCMPCRDFLVQMEGIREQVDEAGVGIVGVGRAADFQAQHLMDTRIGYPLLLDPEEHMYEALELRHFPWWRMLDPRTARNYLRAARTSRQGRIANHPLQAPGVVVVNSSLRILYVHRGQTLGDYPPVADLLAAAVAGLDG